MPDRMTSLPQPFQGVSAEEWREVAGYEAHYEVSNLGRVRSIKRSLPLIISPVRDTPGYLTAKLCKNGQERRYAIHRLVCRAFHGEPRDGQEVAHLDNDRANPRADNLRWVSRSENNQHKAIHGTRQSGVRNGRAKFSEAVIATVRSMACEGSSEKQIARATGVSKSHVHRIIAGETRDD